MIGGGGDHRRKDDGDDDEGPDNSAEGGVGAGNDKAGGRRRRQGQGGNGCKGDAADKASEQRERDGHFTAGRHRPGQRRPAKYQQSANNGGGRRRGACDDNNDNDDDIHNNLIGIEDVDNTCPIHQPNRTISHTKGGRKRRRQRGRLRRVLENEGKGARGGGDNDDVNMTTMTTMIQPPCPPWWNRLWLLWPGTATLSAATNNDAISGGKASGGKNSIQQSTNVGGEGDDGDGRQLCERRGMEEAITSPPLLPAAVTAMSNDTGFCWRHWEQIWRG